MLLICAFNSSEIKTKSVKIPLPTSTIGEQERTDKIYFIWRKEGVLIVVCSIAIHLYLPRKGSRKRIRANVLKKKKSRNRMVAQT